MAPGLLFDTPGWNIGAKPVADGAAGSSRGAKSKKRKRNAEAKDLHEIKGNTLVSLSGNETSAKTKSPALEGLPKTSQKQTRKKRRSAETLEPRSSTLSAPLVSSPAPTTPAHSALPAGLAGSRFRLLNESLYTTSGSDAHSLISKSPDEFEHYHAGFRAQVKGWPVNPVDIIVQKIRAGRAPGNSRTTVVADLGCGEAGLAKALMEGASVKGPGKGPPKHKGKGNGTDVGDDFRVLSFDLKGDRDGWVVEAECSTHVPLPGSLADQRNQIVDTVVCCLSLMGTDWPGMLIEAQRILRPGGVLHIAEVTSRLPSIPALTSFLSARLGFDLIGDVDTKTSTHFVLARFRKVLAGDQLNLKQASSRDALVRDGRALLQPCLYKKR